MGKLFAFLTLLRKGTEVTNVEAWKARQVTGNTVGGVILALVALLKLYDIDLPIDTESALLIGGGFVAVVNVVLTVVTSRRAGLLPAKPAAPDPAAGPGDRPADPPYQSLG